MGSFCGVDLGAFFCPFLHFCPFDMGCFVVLIWVLFFFVFFFYTMILFRFFAPLYGTYWEWKRRVCEDESQYCGQGGKNEVLEHGENLGRMRNFLERMHYCMHCLGHMARCCFLSLFELIGPGCDDQATSGRLGFAFQFHVSSFYDGSTETSFLHLLIEQTRNGCHVYGVYWFSLFTR